MGAGHWKDLPSEPMRMDGARDVTKRVLVSPADGWDGWVMRVFELRPGGHTPRHDHDWPHINVWLEGEGVLEIDGEEHVLRAGSHAFVPAGATHQFRAAGSEPCAFVCIVPEQGDPQGAGR
jgi:quercetin dioxygenase-like cupin family protein